MKLPTYNELTEHTNMDRTARIADLTPTGKRVTLIDGNVYVFVQFTVDGLSAYLQRVLGFANGASLFGTIRVGDVPNKFADLCPAKTIDEALDRRKTIIGLDMYLEAQT